jgi:D-inositol-3-phosphate glycosyltransferase
MTWASVKRCSYLLTTAAHLVDQYAPARELRRRGRVVLAPPGVPPVPAEEDRDDNLMVAIGDVYPHKDYETLIRSLAIIIPHRPKIRLAIIGRAVDEAYAQQLVRLADELGVTQAVDFVGALPHDETMRRLARATLMLSASKAETTSMVVVEAMATGTPVIARDLPFQRAVADGVAVLVPPTDDIEAGFARAALEVLGDRERRTVMQALGREAASRFDWSQTAAAILSVVRRVTG